MKFVEFKIQEKRVIQLKYGGVVESPILSKEGFRIAWLWSSKRTKKIGITHKQEKKGRSGANTRYIAIESTRFKVKWEIVITNVKADTCSDGMFPLITNCDDISLKDIFEKYKYQPKLEKRHEQFKTVYGIAPVLLKNITRVDALLFVFFIALAICLKIQANQVSGQLSTTKRQLMLVSKN